MYLYFAHGEVESAAAKPNAAVTIILVTLVIWSLLLAVLWFLKNHSSWEFPKLKRKVK